MKTKNLEKLREIEESKVADLDDTPNILIADAIEHMENLIKSSSINITPTSTNAETVALSDTLKRFTAEKSITDFNSYISGIDQIEPFDAEQAYTDIFASTQYKAILEIWQKLEEMGSKAKSFITNTTTSDIGATLLPSSAPASPQPGGANLTTNSATTVMPDPNSSVSTQPVGLSATNPPITSASTVTPTNNSAQVSPQAGGTQDINAAASPNPKKVAFADNISSSQVPTPNPTTSVSPQPGGSSASSTINPTTSATALPAQPLPPIATPVHDDVIDFEINDIQDMFKTILEHTYQGRLSSQLKDVQSLVTQSSLLKSSIATALNKGDFKSYQEFLLTIPKMDITPADRAIIKQAAIKLGVRKETASDSGFEVSDTELFQNKELREAFKANKNKIPAEIYNNFVRDLDNYLKGDVPQDKKATVKQFLNNCLKIPGWAKPDPREVELTKWVTTQPGENEAQTQARIRSLATAQVRKAFDDGGLIGDGIKLIQETILDYFLADLADRRLHALNQQGKDNPEPYTPKPYPPIVIDGPPGTGKTSIAEVIAKALCMGFDINALAAETDTNKITGRGSNWASPEAGIVTKAMLKGGYGKDKAPTSGNVVLLDECEKASTEVINSLGNYLEVKGLGKGFADSYFCSSAVMKPGATFFVLATNYYDTLPEHIKSRVKKLNLSGYSLKDKCGIIKSMMGGASVFKGTDAASFSDDDIRFFVKNYSDQPGARELSSMYNELVGKITSEKSNPESPYKDKDGKIIVDQKFITETLRKNFSRLTKEQQDITEFSANFDKLKVTLSTKEEELKKAQQDGTPIDSIKTEIEKARQEVIDQGMKLLTLYNTVTNPKYRETNSIQSDYVKNIQETKGGLEEVIFVHKTKLFEATNTQNVDFFTAKKALNKTQKRKIKKLLFAVNAQLSNVASKSPGEAESLALRKQNLEAELKILKIDSRTLKISRAVLEDDLDSVRFKNKDGEIVAGDRSLMSKHINSSIQKYKKELSEQRALGQEEKVQEITGKIQELEELKGKLLNHTSKNSASSATVQPVSKTTPPTPPTPPKKEGWFTRLKNWVKKKIFGEQKPPKQSENNSTASSNTEAGSNAYAKTTSAIGANPALSSVVNTNNSNQHGKVSTASLESNNPTNNGVTFGYHLTTALEAAKTRVKATIVLDQKLTAKDFSDFCDKEIANSKELQAIVKDITNSGGKEIIEKLSSIRDKFDHISKEREEGRLIKGSPQKKALKDELRTEIKQLGELLKVKKISSLDKIYGMIKKAGEKTSKDYGALKFFSGQLNALSLYHDLKISKKDDGALIVRDGSSDLIEAKHKENKLHISSSMNNPSDAALAQMVIYALEGGNTIGNKNCDINHCENNPEAAIKLYLFSKSLGLNLPLNTADGTKAAVDKFIQQSPPPSSDSTKYLIELYKKINNVSENLNSKEILAELRKWENQFCQEQQKKIGFGVSR